MKINPLNLQFDCLYTEGGTPYMLDELDWLENTYFFDYDCLNDSKEIISYFEASIIPSTIIAIGQGNKDAYLINKRIYEIEDLLNKLDTDLLKIEQKNKSFIDKYIKNTDIPFDMYLNYDILGIVLGDEVGNMKELDYFIKNTNSSFLKDIANSVINTLMGETSYPTQISSGRDLAETMVLIYKVASNSFVGRIDSKTNTINGIISHINNLKEVSQEVLEYLKIKKKTIDFLIEEKGYCLSEVLEEYKKHYN